MPDALPYHEQPHYCRECGEMFDQELKRIGYPAAHAAVWRHIFREHRALSAGYTHCSRYCTQRAQPEEISRGRRIYGKGLQGGHTSPEDLIQPYEKLFPETE